MKTLDQKTWTAWGILWRSKNRVFGERRYLMGAAGASNNPELRGCTGSLMFESRAACRKFIKENFGYIARRKDLQTEPHGWRMPRAVRIEVRAREANSA